MKQGVVERRWLEQATRQEGQPQMAFSCMGCLRRKAKARYSPPKVRHSTVRCSVIYLVGNGVHSANLDVDVEAR